MSGIIPAHAGLTRLPSRSTKAPEDHPRACGAHKRDVPLKRAMQGSSPRMRGSHQAFFLEIRIRGIIPAHAGLTSTIQMPSVRQGDHPRACGAHSPQCAWSDDHTGSSPRMRGSLHAVGVLVELLRIIPAHAGLTYRSRITHLPQRDHPRACGAHE